MVGNKSGNAGEWEEFCPWQVGNCLGKARGIGKGNQSPLKGQVLNTTTPGNWEGNNNKAQAYRQELSVQVWEKKKKRNQPEWTGCMWGIGGKSGAWQPWGWGGVGFNLAWHGVITEVVWGL